MKHIFMLRILFKSYLIRHSGTEHGFKDTQRALEHLKRSGTLALGQYSEGTRTLVEHSDTWRALGHLRHSGTWALRYLGT